MMTTNERITKRAELQKKINKLREIKTFGIYKGATKKELRDLQKRINALELEKAGI